MSSTPPKGSLITSLTRTRTRNGGVRVPLRSVQALLGAKSARSSKRRKTTTDSAYEPSDVSEDENEYYSDIDEDVVSRPKGVGAKPATAVSSECVVGTYGDGPSYYDGPHPVYCIGRRRYKRTSPTSRFDRVKPVGFHSKLSTLSAVCRHEPVTPSSS
jgi:hypothetical protein